MTDVPQHDSNNARPTTRSTRTRTLARTPRSTRTRTLTRTPRSTRTRTLTRTPVSARWLGKRLVIDLVRRGAWELGVHVHAFRHHVGGEDRSQVRP